MGNSLRCCLACVLPCGALDVVRVVHLNGQVEEYSRPVLAGQILAANPNHALSKPCSQGGFGGGGGGGRILIVSPESELKRGQIYFLLPTATVPKKDHRTKTKKEKRSRRDTSSTATATPPTRVASDQSADGGYSADMFVSEKGSSHRRRRSGRVSVWRPHLESIHEDP